MEAWLEPLYDAAGMRAADSWAIEEQGIPSLELMEAAGAAVAEAVESVATGGPVRVVCGKGNNGGDGLVAARHLAGAGHRVEVLLLWPTGELSSDAKANLERLEGTPVRELDPAEAPEALAGSGAIVDAIFGTGFEGAPRAPAETAIEAINGAGAPVVAADVASGVDASTGEVAGAAVDADVTVSFHAAKLGHRIAPGKERTGELRVAPIGIPDGAAAEPAAGAIGPGVLALAPRRGAASTKFTAGQAIVVGGSRGLTGAVCLAATAAIRAGAGYATVLVPADLEQVFEVKLTEVMSRGLGGPPGCLGAEALEPALAATERADAVVLGPGLGREGESLELARELATRIDAPLVIDADGLNAHAGALESLAGRSSPTVLTPHAGELGRLLERPSAEIGADRLGAAREAAARAGAIVVLKGDDTVVAEGRGAGRIAINDLPSPGLATAGSGDVLSGMICALLARGVEPFGAVCAAVRAHAAAGRIAAARVGGAEAVIATDVIAAIPAALAPEDEG
ncbi:MAG TPA: NAD(P)H-hydrate dehydratase [Solirubrobacterales bacterium]|nr:NAD(P)H-hydrate dehydratase [Solirubrobacterales bacterium]